MIFVTAFINLNETRTDQTTATRLEMFQRLVDTGITLFVFADAEIAPRINVPNGQLQVIDFKSMDAYKNAPSGLPEVRCSVKDTREFMMLMNAKTEFIKLCMDVTEDTHYAWIDFSIFHVLEDPHASILLKSLNTRAYGPGLQFPGCLGPRVYWDKVNWRFCGGFFLGDRESLYHLYREHNRVLPTIPHLAWEVNVWAFLESCGMNFGWFEADHNNSILCVP